MGFRQTRVDLDAQDFVRGLGSATDEIVRRVEKYVQDVGMDMASDSQANVPVELGDLRASMQTRTGRTRLTTSRATGSTRGGNYFFEVRYSNEAAWYQELGTREVRPQPFLRPARRKAARDLARP